MKKKKQRYHYDECMCDALAHSAQQRIWHWIVKNVCAQKSELVFVLFTWNRYYCYYCCYCYGFDMDFEFGRVHVCAMDGRAIASECRFTCNWLRRYICIKCVIWIAANAAPDRVPWIFSKNSCFFRFRIINRQHRETRRTNRMGLWVSTLSTHFNVLGFRMR